MTKHTKATARQVADPATAIPQSSVEYVCSGLRAASEYMRRGREWTAAGEVVNGPEALARARAHLQGQNKRMDAIRGSLNATRVADSTAGPECLRGRKMLFVFSELQPYIIVPPQWQGAHRRILKFDWDALIDRIKDEAAAPVPPVNEQQPATAKPPKRKAPHNKGQQAEHTKLLWELFAKGKTNEQIQEEMPSVTASQVRTARTRFNKVMRS